MALKLLPQHSLFKRFYDNASIKSQKSGIKSSLTTSENHEYDFKLSNTTFWQNNQQNTLKRTTEYDSDTMIRVVPKTQRVQVFQTSVAYPCQV
jgi:hypothetical protein